MKFFKSKYLCLAALFVILFSSNSLKAVFGFERIGERVSNMYLGRWFARDPQAPATQQEVMPSHQPNEVLRRPATTKFFDKENWPGIIRTKNLFLGVSDEDQLNDDA